MREKLKQGETLFAEGKIEEAEKYFLKTLKHDSKNKETYNNLGVIAFHNQDTERAIKYFTKSLEIDPYYKDAVLNFSHLVRILNKLHEAVFVLEKIVERYPEDRELAHLLNEARSELQKKSTFSQTSIKNSEPDSCQESIIMANPTKTVDLVDKLSATSSNDGQYICPLETVPGTESMGGSWLWKHKKNVRSQNGEDGIIEKIFEVIGIKSRWCVEFGAWDGEHLSNSWKLINHDSWSAVLIEGDEVKANELAKKYTKNPNVFCIQTWVSDEFPLDSILAQTPIPPEFDLLSVDIDGDDYWAWKACEQYRPRVVVIETNPTFGHDIIFVPKKKNFIGASMRAMVELGKAKGYELAVYTDINCIFVTKEDFNLLHIEDNSCENLFHAPYVPRLVSDYEGNHFLIRGGPWGFKEFFKKDALRSCVCVEPFKNTSADSMADKHKSDLIEDITECANTVKSETKSQSNRAGFVGKEEGKPSGQNDKHILRFSRIKDSNHSLLPEFLNGMREIFDADVFVETGTLHGQTADAARKIFRDVYTIELGEDLFQAAAKRFAQFDNCHTYQGDSADVLKKILPEIEGKIIFWLDAHFSEGITAKGETNTPIIAELQAIKESGKKDVIILIDDIRCFQTLESGIHDTSALQGYPLLQKVRDEIYAIDNAYQFMILGDIAVAFPDDSAVTVSPLVHACTVSRLFDNINDAIDEVFDAEKTIAGCQGEEREAIQMMAESVLATSRDPVGGHYRLWYGLILANEDRCDEACEEFLQAIDRGCNHWRVLWYFAHAAQKAGRNHEAVKALKTLSNVIPEFQEARVLLERSDTVQKWFREDGDNTLRLNYPLSENSMVFDVGGYKGEWSQKIAERYNPNIFIFEPIPQFYSLILERFKQNSKVSVFKFGLLDTTKTERISVDSDSSSIYTSGGSKIEVSLVDIDEFLRDHGIKNIDLIKINIEGAEYPLLKRMIDKGIIKRCRDIQVQFHTFYPDALKLWNEIRSSLRKTHSLTYDYPFVWENWKRKGLVRKNIEIPLELTGTNNIEKGKAAFNRGDLKAARKYFLEALNLDVRKKEAYNNLGVIAFQTDNMRESIDYFTRALQIDPFYKDALLNYTEVLRKFDILNEACPLLEKITEKYPNDKELQKLLNESKIAEKPKRKIAVLCLPGLQSFLGDIVDFLKTKYQIRTCYNNKDIEDTVHWADTVWLEWANELTIQLTNHPNLLNSKSVICRLHSYEAFSGFVKKVKWEKIDDLIFVAKHIKDIILHQLPNLPDIVNNIHIVPNGVNLDKFVFRDRNKGKNLAYLGHINYKKGPMLLFHAFRELVQFDKNYRLFIGGNFQDARYELYFSQMIKELGLERNIQMDGWVEDVSAWLENKHYMVCSSVLEGHPVGLMEAMACGLKPIIHNFVGAKGIYPTKYLWNTIPEFVKMVTHDDYDSSEYRRFIETKYSLNIQLKKINDIFDQQEKVKHIPRRNLDAERSIKSNKYGNLSQYDVTAIIAVRNGSSTIKKAIDSLLAQTVPLKKIIVVDDCSSDDTPKIVERYFDKSNGKIELLKLPYNHWVYNARNVAAQKVETEFFFFLDADDFVDPLYTETLVAELKKNPEYAFIYSDMIHFNGSKNIQTSLPDFNAARLFERNYIPYNAIMRYADFKALGGYDSYFNDSRNHMTEWDLWLRFLAAGKTGKRCPEPFFYYYQSTDQMSNNYERTRNDMLVQMALSRGGSVNFNCKNGVKTLLVCQGKDYLDRSKVGFEVYTWLKPLAQFGEVFTFFYDIESQYYGQDEMMKRLVYFIDKIQPTYIFHPAYKEDISIDCWKDISNRFVTVVWFSDDNWRFESYSQRYCYGFRFAVTTYPEVYKKYKAMGYNNILLSQWAANTNYFQDYSLPKDIDVSFCGQKYGDRFELLEESEVECFGNGWLNGMLDFPEMAKVLNRSKISINFSKGADGKLQMKLRPFEIAASNTLVLTEKTDDLDKYYKIGKEVIVFENKEDLKQKIDYFLKHEQERKKIARAAYERTLRDHTWNNRFEKIFETINEELR